MRLASSGLKSRSVSASVRFGAGSVAAGSPAVSVRPSRTSSTTAITMPGMTLMITTSRQLSTVEQRAGDQRRERVADIAAHAVDRDDQAFAVGVALRQQRDRGRVPEVVADADQRGAGQQQPVVMAEAHQQVGRADPEQRHRHQQALAADGIDEQPARDVGNRPGERLGGQDRADLEVGEPQLVPDQRQKQIKSRGIPMG